MKLKQRVLLVFAFVFAGTLLVVGVVATRPEVDHPMAKPMAGTVLIGRDDFAGEAPGALGWRLMDSDPAIAVDRAGGELRIGGKVLRFEREPDGLRTKRLPTGSFDVRVRVRLVRMTDTGAKEAFLEARSRVGDTFRVYMSPKEIVAEGERTDGEIPPGAEARGRFCADVDRSETETGRGYANLHRVRHIMRLTYDAKSGIARAHVDEKLIMSANLKINEPAFSIGIESPDEGSRWEVAFDDFELYGPAEE